MVYSNLRYPMAAAVQVVKCCSRSSRSKSQDTSTKGFVVWVSHQSDLSRILRSSKTLQCPQSQPIPLHTYDISYWHQRKHCSMMQGDVISYHTYSISFPGLLPSFIGQALGMAGQAVDDQRPLIYAEAKVDWAPRVQVIRIPQMDWLDSHMLSSVTATKSTVKTL